MVSVEYPRATILPQFMPSPSKFIESVEMFDKEALTKIFDIYSPAIFGYVHKLLGDEMAADQIVGDVFAQLLEEYAKGGGPDTNLRAYLFQIAFHMAVDNTRYAKRNADLDVTEVYTSYIESSFTSEVENGEMMAAVLKIMRDELTEDQRHVLMLRFMEGFSVKDTAKIIGKEPNNIKVIQNRGLNRLREALETKGFDLTVAGRNPLR